MEESEPSAALLAGRYRLGARLGAGSRGEVFAARDTVSGADVAIKLLDPVDGDERRRVLREIAALRALQMPGVVPLRDEGRIGARHFIVMDRIDGAPFPGTGGHEAALAIERIAGLLAVLDRVHGVGIVHRDLKPANVLVDGHGAVVVLDFGLARGSSLGATMTASGAAVGTPRYQAPEQMRGLAVDARCDLYAVGVMAFEALAGRSPHPADSLPLLMRARLMEPAPSLADAAPHIPPAVAALVQRLLARTPGDRPPTAAAALAALRGETRRAEWPWLGSRAPIEAIVERIERGQPCAVGGPGRSGRSRAVHEAARALAADRPVMRLVPGERPFASLGGVIDPSGLTGPGTLPARVQAELELILLGGAVLVADEGLDRWTARLLGALSESAQSGRVLTVAPPGAPADVVLGPVTAEELHPLFVGPDRLFHLVEDPATALIERSGGLRGDVIEVLSGWVADGVAQRSGERFAIDRAALQQALARPRAVTGGLEVQGALADVVTAAHLAWPHTTAAQLALALDRPTWEVELAVLELVEQGALAARPDARYEPRAPASALPAWSEARQVGLHARMAASLPVGAEGRLGHLLAGSDARAIVDEALHRAGKAEREGRRAEGIGFLGEALKAVEREASAVDGPSAFVWRLLTAMARLALTEDGRAHIGVVRAEFKRLDASARWADAQPAPARLDRLLALMAAVGGAEPAAVRTEVELMPPFADDAFELARLNLMATAAIYESPEASARTLDAIAPWFAVRSPARQARLAGWRGNLLYRQGRFSEAAALHLEAAEQRADAPGRLACLANAGFALLEAFEFDRAEAVARRLVEQASARRMAMHEAMGERVIRAVAYRTGRAEAADDALVAAAADLRHVTLAATIAINEGAIAWRAGHVERALAHAKTAAESARRSGQRVLMHLAEGLRMLADPPSTRACEAFVADVVADTALSPLPRVVAQLVGVGRRCHPAPPDDWLAVVRRGISAVPEPHRSYPLELLSLVEASAS